MLAIACTALVRFITFIAVEPGSDVSAGPSTSAALSSSCGAADVFPPAAGVGEQLEPSTQARRSQFVASKNAIGSPSPMIKARSRGLRSALRKSSSGARFGGA